MTETGPIFIGGLDRCGKTTLRAFLQSHPNISIPAVGSNMWTYFYQQYGDLSQLENFESCLEAMLRYKHVRFLEPDVDRIRWEFWQGKPTYARLFALFQQHHAEHEGKPRWGDQTGVIERYAGQIFEAYPDAKMLHMIRDPRDRYAGSLALWPNGKARAGGAVARWIYTTILANRNLKKYSGRYMTVKFEDMVYETEQTIRRVCEFLGEEFYPDMLGMPEAIEHRDKLIQRSHGDAEKPPLSPQYIGIYTEEVPTDEIAFMQSIARRSLKQYGYAPEPIHFSLRERAHYLFLSWPLNFVRMLAWLGIELLQHNFPGRFGRKPGSNMIVKSRGKNTETVNA
ncbi:MAG: sulfotransferase [Anaerolineales bacterium]